MPQGSSVEISDATARRIKRGWYGQSGVIAPTSYALGHGKPGRWCPACRFLANAWSRECPRCHQPTVPESEMPAGRSDFPSTCAPVAL